jgi:PAS domain-containing protein
MAPLPLTVSDREGRIIAANRALIHTFGPAPKLIGKRSDEVPSGPAAGTRTHLENVPRRWRRARRDCRRAAARRQRGQRGHLVVLADAGRQPAIIWACWT